MNNILKAIDLAKQNPDSPYASELRKRIETGQLDKELNDAGIAGNFNRPTIAKEPNYLERVMKTYSETGDRIIEAGKTSGESYQNYLQSDMNAKDVVDTSKDLLRTGLRTAGGVAEAAVAPIIELPIVKDALEWIGKKAGQTEPGKKLADILQKNPEISQDIFDVINIVTLGGGKAVEQPVKEAVKSGTKKVISEVKDKVLTTLETNKATRLQNNVSKLDDLVGKVLQGKPEDINVAKRAFKDIDVTDVNTYDDLKSVLTEKIDETSKALDTTLEGNKKLTKLKDLKVTIEGGRAKFNYVKEAINQLSDYYQKTNNFTKLLQVDELGKKANSKGLTVKEINDLARMHGGDLNAFNANGELASGLNKIAAENTRKGLKKTAREIFGDEAYKVADSQISDLINTKDLVDKMTVNVNKIKQRITERGFGEKIGRLAFQVADKFTGGGLKGFVQSFVPRGEGLKLMNALDLEKKLKGNLKQIDGFLKANTEAEAEKALTKLLKPEVVNTVKVNNPIDGNLINVGLNIGNKVDALTQEEVINQLAKRGIKVTKSALHKSDTENTLVAELSRPLTKDELFDLSVDLQQDAIPQLSKDTGILTGPKAESWGDFNPEYFMDLEGKTLGAPVKVPDRIPLTPPKNRKPGVLQKELKAREKEALKVNKK